MIFKIYLLLALFIRPTFQELEVVYKEYFRGNPLSNNAEGWTSNTGIQATNCGSYNIIGGYGVFSGTYLQTKITNLVEHTKIRFQAFFLKIDSWDSEIMTISADGVTIWQKTFDLFEGTNICGSSIAGYEELPTNIDVVFPHTAGTLEIKMWDNLNEDAMNESWGIRDIIISIIFECPAICGSPCQIITI